MHDPREQNHFDYRYIKSKAGPLYIYDKEEERAKLINKKFKTKYKSWIWKNWTSWTENLWKDNKAGFNWKNI